MDTQPALLREFMPRVSQELVQKRRESFAVVLRKRKRDGFYARQRGQASEDCLKLGPMPKILSTDDLTDMEKLIVCKQLLDSNFFHKYEVLKFLNEGLNGSEDPLIGCLVNLGFVENLARMVNTRERDEVVKEATLIVSRISAGATEYIEKMIQNDIIGNLFSVISKQSPDTAAYALWALGNIMAEKEDYWRYIFERGIVNSVSRLNNECKILSDSLYQAFAVILKNICLYPKHLFENDFLMVFNLCCNMIKDKRKNENVYIALGNILNCKSAVTYFFSFSLEKTLIKGIENEKYQHPALKAIGHIIYHGHDSYIQALIALGLLPKLSQILRFSNRENLNTALWSLSNMLLAGTSVTEPIINSDLLELSAGLLLFQDEKVRIEASFVIKHFCILKNPSVYERIVNSGSLSVILQGIIFPEPQYLENLLNALKGLIENFKLDYALQCHMIDEISKLEFHTNPKVQITAQELSNLFIENKA
jgi:hypothetical protein